MKLTWLYLLLNKKRWNRETSYVFTSPLLYIINRYDKN